MTQQARDLLQKALSLSDAKCADIVASSIDSLQIATDERVEAAWTDEIAGRIQQLESGQAKTIPWDQVHTRVSSELLHGR